MTDVMQSLCNCCARETAHDIISLEIASGETPDGSVTNKTIVVRCRGCEEFTILKQEWEWCFGDEDASLTRTVYKPDRLWRRPPTWLSQLEEIDPDLKRLLDEVYSATNPRQVRLLSMGVRAVLDKAMIKILGDDIGGFYQKLQAMVASGHMTQQQKENLEIVIDAGSASSHRGYTPPINLLEQMITVMETVVVEHYITGPMLQTAKQLIPPRPARKKKEEQPLLNSRDAMDGSANVDPPVRAVKQA